MFTRIDPSQSLVKNFLDQFEPALTLKVPYGEMVVAAERAEFIAYAEMLDVALTAIEEWEFETRMNVDPAEARLLAQELRKLATEL